MGRFMGLSRYSVADEYVVEELRREYQTSDAKGRIRLLKRLNDITSATGRDIIRMAVEDPHAQVRQWIARYGSLSDDAKEKLRSDSDPFVKACCLENPSWHRQLLTMMFPNVSHLERLALVRNPRIDIELIEKIFDPKEQDLGIDLRERGELARAFLTNRNALARIVRDACIKASEPARDYLPYATPRAEQFLHKIWTLASKWPQDSWIPDWIYEHVPAPDNTKAEIYQKCSEADLRQTILRSCTDSDEKTLKNGVNDQDEWCRATACEKIPCLEPELLEVILNCKDKAALQGLASNKTFYVNLISMTGKEVTVRELPAWLEDLGYGNFSTKKEETIFLLKKVRDRLGELDRNNEYITIANETIEMLQEEPQNSNTKRSRNVPTSDGKP